MKYLPFEKYTYLTSLSEKEILIRISKYIEPEQPFRFSWGPRERPFEGAINGNTFRMKRLIEYRNSFFPILTATIETTEEGSIVRVEMRLAHFILGFMIFWMSGIFLAFLGFVLKSIAEGFSPTVFIPLGMLIFGYLITTLGFKHESYKYKSFIEELLELSEVRPYDTM